MGTNGTDNRPANLRVEAVEAHTKGLKTLADLLGGLEALDHTTISTIYGGVYMRGVMNGGSPPAFPMSMKWRSEVLGGSKVFRWNPDLLSMISLHRLFRGIVIYYEHTKQESSMVLPTDNDMLLLATHQLLSANYIGFQESLRLAMLIYSTLRIWTFKGLPCILPAVTALRRSLETTFYFLQSTACDLLFWIFFTGGLASKGTLNISGLLFGWLRLHSNSL